MPPLTELPLERPFGHDLAGASAPTDRSRAERGLGRWSLPLIDLASSGIALAAVVLASGSHVNPGLVLLPILLVAINGFLGVYRSRPSQGARKAAEGRPRRLAVRVLVAACFAWLASLIVPLDVVAQISLMASFVVLDSAGRTVSTRLLKSLTETERWIVVGDEATAERLDAYGPLRDHATVVGAVVAPVNQCSDAAGHRVGVLELVDRHNADRVVIASQDANDECLLDLVRGFKAVGVPVSLLPRPLDLVEAPAANPNRVGGVPLIDVEALAHEPLPYDGQNRRRDRRAKVSVVVPAMNEAGNIGRVLSELPTDLHEVILVDGNSRDETIEEARRAYPDIRVVTQIGRGKGDALRSGFAEVTGNLVVMLDADGSADPAEIPRFVAALEQGADFAKGSRFIPGGGSSDITPLRRAGNSVLSLTVNVLHRTSFTDLCYGYNAFWTRCLPYISLDVPGFEVETLINLRIAAAGMKITEVPSHEADRISGQSNLNTFRDGFRVLRTIIRETSRRHSISANAQQPPRREARNAEMVLP